jgi:hypothetical protein
MYEPYTAPELVEAKRIDAQRYKRGQPNLFDAVQSRPPKPSAM